MQQKPIGSSTTNVKRSRKHSRHHLEESTRKLASAHSGPFPNKEQAHQSEPSCLVQLNQREIMKPTQTTTKMDITDTHNLVFEIGEISQLEEEEKTFLRKNMMKLLPNKQGEGLLKIKTNMSLHTLL